MVHRSQIIPHLWLGDLDAALDNHRDYALIVNVTVAEVFIKGKKAKRIRLPVNDDPSESVDLHRFLLKTSVLQDIHDAIINDKDVLVHCQLGMQRSPAVVACYLITYIEGMTPETAIEFIRAQRAIAFPGGSRFQDAIEATYRDKLHNKALHDSALKHPPAAAAAMDMMVENPLTSLLVQPLRRLAEIVSDDVSSHTTTTNADELNKEDGMPPGFEPTPTSYSGPSLAGILKNGHDIFRSSGLQGSNDDSSGSNTPKRSSYSNLNERNFSTLYAADDAKSRSKSLQGGTLNGLSLQQTFLTITDSLRTFANLDEGTSSPTRNATSNGITTTKASVKKIKEKSKEPKPVFWHGLQITPTLIVPKPATTTPSSSSSSSSSSPFASFSSSILRSSSTPPEPPPPSSSLSSSSSSSSFSQSEQKQNTRSLPATRRPSMEDTRNYRDHELSRSINGLPSDSRSSSAVAANGQFSSHESNSNTKAASSFLSSSSSSSSSFSASSSVDPQSDRRVSVGRSPHWIEILPGS